MDIILALLGIAPDAVAVGVGVDHARRIYEKLVNMLFGFIGLILIGWGANVSGYPEVNIYLTLIFALVLAIVWWRPVQTAWVGTIGIILKELEQRGKLPASKQWLLKEYNDVFKTILVIGTVVLFYLSFIPFSAHPGAFFAVIAGAIVTYIIADKWNYGGGFAKKLLFYGACVILAFTLLFGVVPQGFWGGEQSFFGEWISLVKTKGGGVFIFVLFLATIITLIDKRWDAKKEDKGSYTWMVFALVDIMLILFTPPAVTRLWGEYGWHGSAHVHNVRDEISSHTVAHKAKLREQQGGTKMVVARQGAFTEVAVPPGMSFRWDIRDDCLVAIVHDGLPQGAVYDCADHIELGENLRNIRLGFSSKTEMPVTVAVYLTPI